MRIHHAFILLLVIFLSCKAQKEDPPVDLEKLAWLAEKQDVKVGAIWVPEDHATPEAKQIQISYAIIKAKDSTSAAYPVIFFSGGPGGNSINEGFIDFLSTQPMNEKRDIILFDQRGIGYSSPLPDMSFESFDIMAKNANVEEELELTRSMIQDYQQQCKQQGINPGHYNTHQNAKDVGLLFKALGYEKYNLMGGSYGTRLGRVVQDMFPEFIHSSIMDSPSPLSGDFLINRLESYSLSLSRIFDYCKNTPECQSTYPNLEENYFEALAQLEKTPLEVSMNDSTQVFINAQDGIYLIRRLLYQANAREKAPELIKAYLEGSGEVINQVLQFEYQLTGGLNLSMLLSVEKFENFNPANTPEIIKEQYQKYPLIPVTLGFFDAFYQAGMEWHNEHMPMEERVFAVSEVPTLVFVNRFDPVTPPKNGHLFKEKLPNGTLMILDEGGHGGGNQDCKSQVIMNFMDHPEQAPDPGCLNLYQAEK